MYMGKKTDDAEILNFNDLAKKKNLDETKDFQQILRGQNEITIHQRSLQFLVPELYKIVNGIASPMMNSLFQFRCNTHNIRIFQEIF